MPLNGKTKVSIIGFCESSRNMTPYNDPDMEFWGLNRGYLFQPKADRWFELHGEHIYHMQNRRPGNHAAWLNAFQGPVYMHRVFDEIKTSVAYPLQEVADDLFPQTFRIGPHTGKCPNAPCDAIDHSSSAAGPLGGCKCECHGVFNVRSLTEAPYLSSSIALEMALAIHEGFAEIHLYGVDLNTESEYAWQKPGVEYMCGIAAGRGIKVYLPDNCPLLTGTIYGRGFLSPTPEHFSYEQLDHRLKALQGDRQKTQAALSEAAGVHQELTYLLAQAIPGADLAAVAADLESVDPQIKTLAAQNSQLAGQIKETAEWFARRLAELKAGKAATEHELSKALGIRLAVNSVLARMGGGVNHEKLDTRRKKIETSIQALVDKVNEFDGRINETSYWLSQTTAGQWPDEAMEQLRQLNREPEGPLTESQLLRWDAPAETAGSPVIAELPATVTETFNNGHRPELVPVGGD